MGQQILKFATMTMEIAVYQKFIKNVLERNAYVMKMDLFAQKKFVSINI